MRRIDELIAYKKWLFREYEKGLRNIDGIQLSSARKNVNPTYWISVAILDEKYGLDKETLGEYFAQENIDLRPLFYPVSSMPPFKSYLPKADMSELNPVTYKKSKYGVCLPNGNNLNPMMFHGCVKFFKRLLGDKN